MHNRNDALRPDYRNFPPLNRYSMTTKGKTCETLGPKRSSPWGINSLFFYVNGTISRFQFHNFETEKAKQNLAQLLLHLLYPSRPPLPAAAAAALCKEMVIVVNAVCLSSPLPQTLPPPKRLRTLFQRRPLCFIETVPR